MELTKTFYYLCVVIKKTIVMKTYKAKFLLSNNEVKFFVFSVDTRAEAYIYADGISDGLEAIGYDVLGYNLTTK